MDFLISIKLVFLYSVTSSRVSEFTYCRGFSGKKQSSIYILPKEKWKKWRNLILQEIFWIKYFFKAWKFMYFSFSIMILQFFSPLVSTLLHTKTSYTSGILVYAPPPGYSAFLSMMITVTDFHILPGGWNHKSAGKTSMNI